MKLVAEGRSSKEVAHVLEISPSTVEAHRCRLMEKIGIHSVTELVRYAIRNNIVEC